MDKAQLIAEIARKDYDLTKYAALALNDAEARETIVQQLLSNRDIMVYYHCYEIVSRASLERPALFYAYWRQFAHLLQDSNSYHRDIALTVLAHLTKADSEDLFGELFDEYFVHLNDVKFMTALCCVRHAAEIVRNKKVLLPVVSGLLLKADSICAYPDAQLALLKHDVVTFVDEFYPEAENKAEIVAFVKQAAACESPKTRKRAKEFLRKHTLTDAP